MAANSTPLASQFAAGVAVPRRYQQLRTNLITTRSRETKIMASRANPALKYEAGAFGSKPSQLKPYSVPKTKRDKFVTYAFPGTITVDIPTSGVPEYTHIQCNIETAIDVIAKVVWMNFWVGSEDVSLTSDGSELKDESSGDVKKFEHEFKGTHEFYHSADTTDAVKGSVGCLSYDIGNNLQWVVAWRNSTNERNKVYTTIVSGPLGYANVSKIKRKLYHSTNTSTFSENDKYVASAIIDRDSPKPRMIATLSLLSLK